MRGLRAAIGRWMSLREDRRRYSTNDRWPFYEVAARYLPTDTAGVILDIGPGDGGFVDRFANARPHVHLLEGNPATAAALRLRHAHVIDYKAPGRLPFPDASVTFIHCSHVVEHLEHQALYDLLQEVDRVLRPAGVLVISTPLLWEGFYADLSHVKPYNPEVFRRYLGEVTGSRSANVVAHGYETVDVTYRYATRVVMESVGASSWPVDLLLRALSSAVRRLGIRAFVPNGYTLVMRKPSGGETPHGAA